MKVDLTKVNKYRGKILPGAYVLEGEAEFIDDTSEIVFVVTRIVRVYKNEKKESDSSETA